MNNKHEFAIYFENLASDDKQELIINDKNLYHRIVNILRLKLGEKLILFNKNERVNVEINNISKKEIKVNVLNKSLNKKLKPKITVLISILKREAFEEAIYYCVELGANIIQPVITQKIHFKKFENKEYERFNRIIIAAAEQSKNFHFPELLEPKKLEDIIENLEKDSLNIFFDVSGQIINEALKNQNVSDINLLIGPEGDLTSDEKENLKKFNFKFYKLTPTILRAQTAVSLGLGIFRSSMNEN